MTYILQIQKKTKIKNKKSPFFPPAVCPKLDLAIAHGENCFPVTEQPVGSLA